MHGCYVEVVKGVYDHDQEVRKEVIFEDEVRGEKVGGWVSLHTTQPKKISFLQISHQ